MGQCRGSSQGEREAEDVGPERRSVFVACVQSHFAVEQRDADDAEEMQAEDEHRRQAHHEEYRRDQRFAPGGLNIALDVIHRDPAHIGEVRRHDGQHAGAEEAQYTGGQRDQHCGQKRRVKEVYSKHILPLRGATVALTRPPGHIRVDAARKRFYLSPMTAVHDIEARDLLCPLPVLRLRKAIAGANPGDTFRLVATDPAALIDVPHFCAEQGHVYLGSEDLADGATAHLIRRGA